MKTTTNSDDNKKDFELMILKKFCYLYVGSVFSASIAEMITYPLDLTKTRLQIQGEIANTKDIKVLNAPHRGLFKTAIGIAREEGLHKLWQGCIPALYRHVFYSGTRIVSYQILKDKVFVADQNGHFPLWKSALSGIFAGSFAQLIASPADLIKVQIQMEGKRKLLNEETRVTGSYDAFRKIVQKSGLKGLWKGSIPNAQRAALVNLGDLTTYDTVKRFLLTNTNLKDNSVTHILSSASAGLMAAVMGTPADVIKTRIMNQPTDNLGRGLIYSSSLDCLRKTIGNEGFLALYKGFVPVWIRMGPWSLIFWLSFENFQKFSKLNYF